MGDFLTFLTPIGQTTPLFQELIYVQSPFIKATDESFLTQHVTVPTRDNSILDLILSSEPDLISTAEAVGNLDNSNHSMLTFHLHLDHAEACHRQESRVQRLQLR